MSEDLPRISIITVVRNAAGTLGRAMESVFAQAYPNTEYMVLDAASTDGTAELIQAQEHRLAFWRSHPDDGATAAYNEGLARATGDIICFLNADDWYEPGILRRIGEIFRAEPPIDLLTCEARVWKQEADGTETLMRTLTGKSLQLNPFGTPMPNARFFRKRLFEQHGQFLVYDNEGKRIIANDLEFMLRLSQHPLRNHILPEVGYHYLMHAGSLTMGGDGARDKRMYLERAYIAELYLASPALAKYRGRLRRWHRRGTTRDFYWQLQEKEFKKAWQALKRGVKVSRAAWLADAIRIGITGSYKL